MFSANSAKLIGRRNGILGQFKKAAEGLIELNEQIDQASIACEQRQEDLQAKIDLEDSEQIELNIQKTINIKTISKIQDFLQ